MRADMKVAIALAALLILSANVLMVLPGYYLFIAADLPFGRFFGPFHGDNWLPVAMQMQMLWAPSLPASLWLARRMLPPGSPSGAGWRGNVKILVLVVVLISFWAVGLAALLHRQALSG